MSPSMLLNCTFPSSLKLRLIYLLSFTEGTLKTYPFFTKDSTVLLAKLVSVLLQKIEEIETRQTYSKFYRIYATTPIIFLTKLN